MGTGPIKGGGDLMAKIAAEIAQKAQEAAIAKAAEEAAIKQAVKEAAEQQQGAQGAGVQLQGDQSVGEAGTDLMQRNTGPLGGAFAEAPAAAPGDENSPFANLFHQVNSVLHDPEAAAGIALAAAGAGAIATQHGAGAAPQGGGVPGVPGGGIVSHAGGPPAPSGLDQISHGVNNFKKPLDAIKNEVSRQINQAKAQSPGQGVPSELDERKLKLSTSTDLAGVAINAAKTGQGFEEISDGNTVKGIGDAASGALNTFSKGLNLQDDVLQKLGKIDAPQNKAKAGEIAAAASVASGVSGVVSGVDDLRHGKVFDGVTELVGGTLSTASGATSIIGSEQLKAQKAAKEAQKAAEQAQKAAGGPEGEAPKLEAAGDTAKVAEAAEGAANASKAAEAAEGVAKAKAIGFRPELGGTVGKFAAPLAVAGAAVGAVSSTKAGIEQIRNGQVIEGSANIAQGALGAASGAAFAVDSIGTASEALGAFGEAAGPLGGAAAAIGGGLQAFEALKKHPPDLKGAALGGVNVAGGVLLAIPATAPIGTAVLIGAALYQNVKPIRELVDAQLGAEIEVGKGLFHGAVDLGKGLAQGEKEAIEGALKGGKEAIGGIVSGEKDVAKGFLTGAGEALHGFGDAADDLAKGDVLGAAHAAVGGVVHGAEDAAKGVVKGAGEAAKGVFGGIFHAAEGAAKGAEDAAKGAVHAAEDIGKGVEKGAERAVKGAKNAAKSVADGAKSVVGKVGGFVSDLL